ncbi:cytochrome o ubiquinol oxidase subunit IV [Massilia sp. Dwa41.01b]|uniref:cytochrome o ubiquinol oxidase subunit IV n=1 Tax=unclassified Massilia TaxID=2609279 RepID=UPI0015FEF107|nr:MULTISPECIES: cytochrome o ubiquinol oxidase subunit IV [unclassified Massilia]QNA89120.1 cytochrome o ubiquinol oxidase subunit IV [Massilia sp. Dwa41.01b]QNB00013.1 cytochrome o ubiquinol oxidase subunit IV [Massilia sp. Se16.2.3]
MSEHHNHHAHGAHDALHGHTHGDEPGVHYSLKDYTIGFVLAVILTAIPFWLVMNNVLDPAMTKFVIMGFAAVQLVVHMVYFLHMNSKSEGGWNMMALILTLVLLGIVLSGSIWVMYHMNANMMPGMGDAASVTGHGMHDMK